MSSKKRSSKKIVVIFCIFLAVFIFSATRFFSIYTALQKERGAFQSLAEMVETPSAEISAQIVENKYSEDGILLKYKELYDLNPDAAGWIYVEDTEINYPVMFTPDEPDYYLYRSFDKASSGSGTPFLGEGCTPDSMSVLIHGHNMKNGTMFGSLEKYREVSFWETHPTFRFDTLREERTYEVIAAIKARALREGEKGFPYYDFVGDLTEEAFDELLQGFKTAALYDTGVWALYGDRLLMLSTCAYHHENGRFVVLAKEVS